MQHQAEDGLNMNLECPHKKTYDFYKFVKENNGIHYKETFLSRATCYRYIKELTERYQCEFKFEQDCLYLTKIGLDIERFEEQLCQPIMIKDIRLYNMLVYQKKYPNYTKNELYQQYLKDGIKITKRQFELWFEELEFHRSKFPKLSMPLRVTFQNIFKIDAKVEYLNQKYRIGGIKKDEDIIELTGTIRKEDLEDIQVLLNTFGSSVTVYEPIELRQMMISEAIATLDLYNIKEGRENDSKDGEY